AGPARRRATDLAFATRVRGRYCAGWLDGSCLACRSLDPEPLPPGLARMVDAKLFLDLIQCLFELLKHDEDRIREMIEPWCDDHIRGRARTGIRGRERVCVAKARIDRNRVAADH